MSIFPAATPGRFLATLLVAALFFCHGVFGYEHQLTPLAELTEAPEASAAHHAHHHGPTTDQGGHYQHPVDGGYFATLLVLLLGALLLRGVAPASLRLPALELSKRSSRPPVFHPLRAPTAPFLQVFRL